MVFFKLKLLNPNTSYSRSICLYSRMFIFLNYCESKLGLSFGEALAIHKEPLFGAHKCTTPNLSPNVEADGHESKFVEIKQVLQEVNQTPLDVLDVGDTRVEDIKLLLRDDIDQLHMVGIGGIGKTNLA
ncbi:hypothetical protein H5410_030044 [Solanum commersonii]|uniref:Uncharacterized protein n=1 Tax=Solanum commersonii TaxID=4109 RepID=A0A9J5YEM4_SOLCO|nr:hypothetical protein H5410_030044 [Solanum commersonii]